MLTQNAPLEMYKYLTFQRRTKQKVVTDFSTLSKGTSAGAKPRAALRQVLFSQGVSDKNPVSEERGQLDVLKQDLQAYAVPVILKWRWKEESLGTTLEKNWTEIVDSHATMSKMQRHQQEALWEFVHTELTYINKLIIIKDLVIAALVNLHQHGFLQEVTPELLFSNLPSILSAHQLFWQEVIYPMLHEVRRTGKPFDPMRLEAGCLQFHERFSSYKHYCWEEENNLEFTRRQMESNPHFLTYVQWVETHPQCERMRLGDMQAKPHQRITKYSLLLQAVLKNTPDSHVQQILRGMLSSVNSFLESINDYLRLKDEELALSISAQRVEGYEVEGINEEIDKHVREICQFDLTCPIRGVGPEVVRRLLLEENLKIRDRKDSKLEVVALLFSDVLLMTKVPKKGERLRVVRPPLTLDKTSCIALKDGCSFLLVEVGELWSAMNVYIFAASSPERCSTWVSTIHQAKETLMNLRQMERNRQLENWKIQQEAKPITEAKTDDMETEEEPLTQSRGGFVDELTEELAIPQSINGILSSKEAEAQYEPADDMATNITGPPFWQSQPNDKPSNSNCKSVRRSFAGRQQAVKGYEWIEMGVRAHQDGHHAEEEEKIVESPLTNERWVNFNNRTQSAPNLDLFMRNTASDPFRYNTIGPHNLLLGGLPDVDYPTDEESAFQLPYQPTMSQERPEFQRPPGEGGISTRRNSQTLNQDIRRNSSYSQSGDMEISPEAWISKNLKSPGLRRKRPVTIHQGPSSQIFQGSGDTWAASNNSSSNSDSDYNMNMKRNSLPSGQSSDSHRVLKLGSLKPNQGMFWYMHDRVSPDPQTLSEPELPDLNFHGKRPKMKTQRSASIPNIVIEGGHGPRLHSSSLYTLPQDRDTPFPMSGKYPNGHPSPLEGLLERAKGRQKERDGLKRERNLKVSNLRSRYRPPSPSFSTTPSPSPSEGDRDTEWEEVHLVRHRAPTVSKGWKEQLVDGDEDDNRNSVIFTEGVNVDWPGWCFDDDEVMDHLHPGGEGLLEGISRSLTYLDIHEFPEQEDGECSQV
ncbi:pleckstrin homology domain-containing family G member 6 [Lates japonicus]